MALRKGYQFPTETCHKCGAKVAQNWYVAHLKSGCQKGAKR